MQSLNRLTALQVKGALKAGRHADGGNLYLNVSQTGAKSWVFMFRWEGKPKEMGLGSVSSLPLSKAREMAAQARQQIVEGRNPLELKRAAKSSAASKITFGAFADEFVKAVTATFKNEKHRAQWEMTLRVYAAPLRGKAIDQITTADVLAVLQPIWLTKGETAKRLQGRIENVLDSAKAQGLYPGDNPARWRHHLENVLRQKAKVKAHHAALPYGEVPGLMKRLAESDSTSSLALRLLILTACRTGELLGAKWAEIDLQKKIWTIPKERMKANREHRVPLTPMMVRILEKLHELQKINECEFVVPGQRKAMPISATAVLKALTSRIDAHATLHGFRSCFRDWAGDETSHARETAEAALAHRLGDAAELSYRRGDALEKRRKLMLDWEKYLTA